MKKSSSRYFLLYQKDKYKTIIHIYMNTIYTAETEGTLESLQVQQRHLCVTLWTSTPVDTWDTVAAPAVSSATLRCSACGNSGNTDPTRADSRLQALCLKNEVVIVK